MSIPLADTPRLPLRPTLTTLTSERGSRRLFNEVLYNNLFSRRPGKAGPASRSSWLQCRTPEEQASGAIDGRLSMNPASSARSQGTRNATVLGIKEFLGENHGGPQLESLHSAQLLQHPSPWRDGLGSATSQVKVCASSRDTCCSVRAC